MARVRVVFQLLRARMTVISAVTYIAAALLPRQRVAPGAFLCGYAFVLSTQFAVHALGDAADYATDALNTTATPFTGGSRALLRSPGGPPDPLPRGVARLVGAVFMLCSLLLVVFALPRPAHQFAFPILALAYGYGAPPFLFNHRGLGEVTASFITNVLLPMFAAAVTLGEGKPDVFPAGQSLYDVCRVLLTLTPGLALLIVPTFFIKVACFLVLNMADRRPDWATGKRTLAVILGDTGSVHVVKACHLLAYASVVVLGVFMRSPIILVCILLATAPYGWLRIVRPLAVTCPYRKDHILAPTLFHSTLFVWPFAAWALLERVLSTGVAELVKVEVLFVAFFGFVTIANIVGGRSASKRATCAAAENVDRARGGEMKPSKSHSCRTGTARLPSSRVARAVVRRYDSPFGGQALPASSARQSRGMPRAPAEDTVAVNDYDVVIVGAGVGGLVTAACLRRLGRSAIVLERRPSSDIACCGADLALWPGAVSILRELGVSADFFAEHCFPVETVHMCNMDFRTNQSFVLKTISMREVAAGTGERFVLVARSPLMTALQALVPEGRVIYGANVVDVEESETVGGATVTCNMSMGDAPGVVRKSMTSRVVIGADGVHSAMRAKVVAQAGGSASVDFCHEVCYRGVLNLRSGEPGALSKLTALLPDKPQDYTMRINYGAGMRSSFGYMSAPPDPSVAYWWVKEVVPAMPADMGKMPACPWPEPLKSLHDLTPENSFYVHAIVDSEVLPKWSSTRIVLVGDSAHTVTPNMGQGACMAIEDGFVLANQLARYWHEVDGHLEAFYNYEHIRKPYASAVRSEARKQLVLGQLRHPIAVSMREALLRGVPSSVLERRLRNHNFKVSPVIDMYRDARITVG